MTYNGTLKIAALRGPSAVEMVEMMSADANGAFDITVFDEPAQLLGELACGTPDFAVLPAAAAASLHEIGVEYSIVAIIIRGGLYVCGNDVRIRGVNDLKGATINVMRRGTPPENMLRHLIVKAGMVPDVDVRFDYSYPTHRALYEAAADGRSKLCVLSEPFVSQVLGTNDKMHVLLDICSEWQKVEGSLPPVTVFLCKDALASLYPDTVGEVIAALKHSCEWVKSHPQEAAGLVADLGIFNDTEAVSASIPRSGFEIVGYMVNN